MSTYTFSIGRNIGAEPMETHKWVAFIRDLRITVRTRHTLEIVFHGEGKGSFDGLAEDSYTLVAIGELGYQRDLESLTDELRRLARHYSQEAIAFTIGETQLIG